MKISAEHWGTAKKAATRAVPILVLALMLIAAASPIQAGVLQPENDDEPQVSELNPELEAYLENPPEVSYGYVPPTVNLGQAEAILPSEVGPMTLPSSFDWRLDGKVTPVRNQNPCGTCWTFGTLGALESAALIAEGVAYNFSEQSVALCVDRSWTYLYDESDEPCMGGGNSLMASDVLATKGVVAEGCNPYNTAALQCNGSCVCDACPPVKRVDGYRLVTNDEDQIAAIKNALQTHGPLVVSFYHDDAYEYTDGTWGTIYDYYPSPASANHCVLMVGWNDAVPHPNPAHSGTGAWLIKNSWGTGHGDNGYGWLAYQSSHTTEVAYLRYRDPDPNEQLLYWDEAGYVGWRGWNDSTWMASVFTAPEDASLTHVEFWSGDPERPGVDYEIYVWNGRFGGQLAHKSGSTEEFGYYSIPLNTPVSLTSGQEFTIGVKLSGVIPVEAQIAGVVNPTIQTGVSFIRHLDGSSWQDLAGVDENACLRGRLTSAVVPNRPPTISGLPDITVPRDSSRNNAIDLWAYASDPEDADDQLSFSISNAPVTAAGVSVDGRYVDVNPDSGWTGSTNVEVEVQDTGGLVDSDTFQVTVKIINYTENVYLPLVLRAHVGSSPGPPPSPSGLANGDFEDGPTGWTEYSAHGWDLIVTEFAGSVTPRSGSWAAWLGGEANEVCYIQQQVTVPSSNPYLSYWHWIASEDVCGYDYGGVVVDSTVVDEYELCDSESTGGWVRHVVDLGAYVGESVSLQIRVETDDTLNSNLFVDDVAFQASGTSLQGGYDRIDSDNTVLKSAVIGK